MSVYEFSPLEDARWDSFIAQHAESSVFHSSPWLRALQSTYGYEPIACTTTPPGQPLRNALVFCRIRSWLTGTRLVSLPFSDHCQPLVESTDSLLRLLDWCQVARRQGGWRYVEIRPVCVGVRFADENSACSLSGSYLLQSIDLRPPLDAIFGRFHKSCVQRKIHRAEREQLDYEEGRSTDLLRKFYFLSVETRRRHGLPPQPVAWFQNLLRSLGESICIRVVSRAKRPVASIITIRYKTTLVYKYGCSEERFHNLGGMSLLFWKAIQDAKQTGALEYDLGRSERDNPSLVSYKARWGAATRPLNYYRFPAKMTAPSQSAWRLRIVKDLFSRLPGSFLTAAGRVLYRHLG